MPSDRTLVYPVGDDESPSEATALAVARHLDESVDHVRDALHERIDPEAMDRLLGTSNVVVEFAFYGREVRVRSETQVEVRPA